MADSASLRVKGHTQHINGNHLLCRPQSCEDAPSTNARPNPIATSVEDSVSTFVSQFHYGPEDPRGVLSVVAVRVAKELDVNPNASLSHELSAVLMAVSDQYTSPASDQINEIAMRRHVRRLADVLDGIGTTTHLPKGY